MIGGRPCDFRSPRPRAVAEWIQPARLVQDLLTLAVDSPCALLRQTLVPSEETMSDRRLSARSEVLLYTRQLTVGQPTAPGAIANDGLFSLRDIEFADVLPTWRTVVQRHTATCNMVLGLHDEGGGYIQTQVLTAVTAAEAMHKALFGGRVTLKERLAGLAATPYPRLVERVVPNRKPGHNRRRMRAMALRIAGRRQVIRFLS
jgi:hypothetical protein